MANSKSLLPYGFKAEAARIAEAYRKELRLSVFAPLDAFDLANHLGIEIFSANELLEPAEARKLIGIPVKPSEFSAIRICKGQDKNIIIHNPYNSAYRQQSDIMHEIAHCICKHETDPEVIRLALLLNLRPLNAQQEEEAKYLGACLQITRPGLMWALKHNFSYAEISAHFKASHDMVRFRINTTGVEKQRAYMFFKKN